MGRHSIGGSHSIERRGTRHLATKNEFVAKKIETLKKTRFADRVTKAFATVAATAVVFGSVSAKEAIAAPEPVAASFNTLDMPRTVNVPKTASAQEVQLMSAPVATALPMAEQAPAPAPRYDKDWDRLATCESGDVNIPGSGQWNRTDGIFDGGLQFTPETWDGFGGGAYASTADQATREQQIEIAEKVFDVQGPGAWPTCSFVKVPDWYQHAGPEVVPPIPDMNEAPIPAPMPEVVPVPELVMPVDAEPNFAHSHDPRPTAVDFPASCDTEVHAPKSGTVVEVSTGYNGGWGNSTVVDHHNGTQTRSAHMEDGTIAVSEGQEVSAGTVLGRVGNTGASEGCHLHVETIGISAVDFFSGAAPTPEGDVAPSTPAPAPEAPIPAPEAPALPQAVVPEQLQPYVPEAEPAPEQTWTEPVVPPEAQPWIEQNVPQYEELVPTPAPAPEQFQEPAPAPAPAPMPEWVPSQFEQDLQNLQTQFDRDMQNFNNMFAQPR